MSILATCLTLLAAIAAQPSEPIRLKDNCGELVLRAERPVTIEAEGSTIKGLRLKGNIRWKGGTITAPGGLDANALAGYAVKIEGRGNSVYSARVKGANRGFVVDLAQDTVIGENVISDLRVDGIIVSRSDGVQILRNRLFSFVPHPSRCVFGGVVTTGVAKRDCLGTWTDGSHPDGIQFRNDVKRLTISGNTLFGEMQGIAEMTATGDLPSSRVSIRGNVVAINQFHAITVGTPCNDNCLIAENTLRRGHPDRKAVIRAGGARRCGNDVQDEAADSVC